MSDRVEIRPGLCSVALRARSAEDVVALAAEAGLEGIEWGGDVHVPVGDLARARSVRARTVEAGMVCASYGSYLRVGATDEAEVATTIATAEALGAPNVRVWCDWGAPGDVDAARRASMIQDLRTVAGRAGQAGLTVSLEFHRHTLTETAASATGLIEEVGEAALFSCWQPVEGLDPERWWAELTTMVPVLSNLHVFWWRDHQHRFALADGSSLWPDALELATRVGRWPGPRWALVEFVRDDSPDQLRHDAATLRRWLTLPPVSATALRPAGP